MATLAQLRDRVIRETNRDDLLDASGSSETGADAGSLDLCIQQAIKYFETQRFTFNEARIVTPSVASSEYVDLPAGLKFIDILSVEIGSNRYPLRMQSYEVIEEWNGYATSAGQPTDFSVSNGVVRLYPIPNSAYPLIFLGVREVSPALDYDAPASTNAWLVQGYDLITARTKYLLYRDYFRDDVGASMSLGAQEEALSELRNEASRQIGTGRFRGSW